MRKYIFIGMGGFLGAISRVAIESVHIYHYKENIPLNTLLINIAGSFVLALILTIAFELWNFDADLRQGIATGFLGAFTTFSTMCKETTILISRGFYFSAISYITISTVLGLSAAYFGIVVGRELIIKLIQKRNKKEESKIINLLEGEAE